MKALKRHNLPLATPVMLEVLRFLRQCQHDGWPFVTLDDIHKRTLNSLFNRDWIARSDGPDRRYKITARGLHALKIYEAPSSRRSDGLCPSCGIRPKRVYPSGRLYGYCIECEREHKRKMYQMGRTRMNPDAPCCQCHERPRYRTANGHVYAYCAECRHERRAAERTRQHALNLERIRRGEVLLCRRCKQRPRRYTDKYVYDYCPECQRQYTAEYNQRRRHPEAQL